MDIHSQFKTNGFSYTHTSDTYPDSKNFRLHNHNDTYEILIFLSGNSEFRVEGTLYYPKPGDVLVTHSAEMHRMYHNEPIMPYERIVINIHSSFFAKNNCEDFKKIFTSRPLGENNLISSDETKKHNIDEIINAVDRYISENEKAPAVLIQSKLIELLYNLNKISFTSENVSFHDEQIKTILMFINDNITSELNLDTIADHMYMNKYHLCHIFKSHTGYTLNKYITYKRILLVRELYESGMSLMEASQEAGFSNYSNFYKMYKKETGKSPKNDLN
ncbi:MAG: helix-turn-helix transcriptional regulator [Clostridia bacterium]|nr:helix-turn-helix transcriptional regulator [Clostridia bacterium]